MGCLELFDICLAVDDVAAYLQVGWPSALAPPVLQCLGGDPPPTRKLKRIDVSCLHVPLRGTAELGEHDTTAEVRQKLGRS